METVKKILSGVGFLFPSYFTWVGVWILSLSISCVYLVFFTLSIFQIQSIITGTAKIADTAAFVDHTCNIRPLKSVDNLKNMPGIMDLECIPNPTREVEYYTVSDLCLGNNCNKTVADSIKELTDLKKSIKSKIDSETNKESREFKIRERNFNAASARLKALQEQKTNLDQEARNLTEVIDNLKHYQILFQPISALLEIEEVWRIPTFIMAIWLSLAMGALGSLVFITIQYLSCDQEKFAKKNVAEYIFRPILGALMALVMHIVIRSGQDSFFLDNSVTPSAFITSFVSVMSGMASESIYKALNKNFKSKLGEE